MLRKNLKEYQNPDHEFFASMALSEKYQQEGQQKNYTGNMKRWDTDWPANINQFIAGKLQKMLEYTKDIDCNAAMVEKYGEKKFVNQTYEYKKTDPIAIGWKQGFRAGKEVTEQHGHLQKNG